MWKQPHYFARVCFPYHFAFIKSSLSPVPTGSPSRAGDVAVYVFDLNQPSLPTPLILFLWLFCLYGPFNCISFQKFSRQLSAFSPYSSGLIYASVVLSTIYLFMKVSLSPDILLCVWLGLKRQLTSLLPALFLCLWHSPQWFGTWRPTRLLFETVTCLKIQDPCVTEESSKGVCGCQPCRTTLPQLTEFENRLRK